jgi:hypothetical protein
VALEGPGAWRERLKTAVPTRRFMLTAGVCAPAHARGFGSVDAAKRLVIVYGET